MKKLPTVQLRTDDDRRQHQYCQECKLACEASGKDWDRIKSNCHGIYDEEDFVAMAAESGMPIDEVREIMNPSEWIRNNLGMSPYWYQDRSLRCTSIRKMFRWGRRTGKTQSVAAWLIYLCCTVEATKALCITPMKAQAKEIFDRIEEFFAENPEIKKDIKTKQQPYYEINFKNRSRIRVIVAGTSSGSNAGTAVRGQEASIIFIDEMDYLDDDASKAILPVLSDPERKGEPVKFTGSSTPTGKEGTFFKLCHDGKYREFHIPSRFRPDWNDELEEECRVLAKTDQNFQHEYEAEWGTKSDGVFRRNDVIRAQEPYKYWRAQRTTEEAKWPEMTRWPHWTYMIGVDWNGAGTGTRIVIVGYDPQRTRWYIVYREVIDIQDFALHTAVNRIVELNRKWRPHSIYIDSGFGQMQDEILRSIGKEAISARTRGEHYEDADINLASQLKAIDFGSTMEYKYRDPDTKKIEKRKMRTKNYMVENLQHHFELDSISLSRSDTEMKQQLMGYSVARQDTHGQLIFKADDELGDHDLDALLLAMFAFNREFDPFFQKNTGGSDLRLVKRPGQKDMEPDDPKPDPAENPAEYHKWLQRNNGNEKDKRQHGVTSREIKKPQSQVHPGMIVTSPKRNVKTRGGGRHPSKIPSRNSWFNKPRGGGSRGL